jgi:hypothetical protein
MAKGKGREESAEADGPKKTSQFRLGPGTLADLDLIAEHHAEATGLEVSRTDAVRIAAKKEADRIRKSKGSQ